MDLDAPMLLLLAAGGRRHGAAASMLLPPPRSATTVPPRHSANPTGHHNLHRHSASPHRTPQPAQALWLPPKQASWSSHGKKMPTAGPQRAQGRSTACTACPHHAHLGCDQHDVDVGAEVALVVLHDAQQEAMRQAQRRPGLHGSQDARVERCLQGERGKGGGSRTCRGDQQRDSRARSRQGGSERAAVAPTKNSTQPPQQLTVFQRTRAQRSVAAPTCPTPRDEQRHKALPESGPPQPHPNPTLTP
jgi:hypothetical protein